MAEEEYKQALAFHSKNAQACVRYGEFLFTCGRYKEALDYYRQAKLQDPEKSYRILYLLRMIEVYFVTNDYAEALNKCSLALSYQPRTTRKFGTGS